MIGSPQSIPPCVLLADNDDNVAAILRAFLVRKGLAVEVVGDGRAALERIQAGGIALLVCDLDMPIMSGEALLEALRRAPESCPPIIVVSGYVDEPVAARLGSHPAVREILRKPFDVRAFAERASSVANGSAPGAADPSAGSGLLF